MITTSDEVFCANIGDSKAFMKTPLAKANQNLLEMTINHSVISNLANHHLGIDKVIDKIRAEKCGLKFRYNKIMNYEKLKPNIEGEILDGCPVFRCLGEQRLKCTPEVKMHLQGVIA